MTKHCPICNRSSNDTKFFGEFCEFCTKERLGARIPKSAKIMQCKRCGRIKVSGNFVEKNDSNVEAALKKEFKGFLLKLLSYTDTGAIVELELPEQEISGLRQEIELKFAKAMCDRCNMQSGGYYEAVFQLRGSQEKIERTVERINKFFQKNDGFISKVLESDGGYDVYVSSKKLATEFVQERRLKPIMSYQLYGQRGGKRVYRNIYALHL